MPAMSKTPTTLKPGSRLERGFAVERGAVNTEARTVELSFASEEPYERWWGVEILDCSATAMRMARIGNGRAPLLCDHDTRDQIGVVESVTLGPDRRARAIVRFGNSARANEVFQDVADGIRANVSVGYLIHKAQLVETTDEQDTYRVTDWEPYEVSLVSVPADVPPVCGPAAPRGGVGRALDDPRTPLPVTPEIRSMTAAQTESTAALAVTPAAPALNVSAVASEARQAEQSRARELLALGEQFAQYGAKEIALRALESGATVDATRADIMNAIASAQTQPVPHLDMSP
ncbi:MAG: HK97 family phage prohead protease, partial [Inhella sp.]